MSSTPHLANRITTSPSQTGDWQQQLQDVITDPIELLALLQLDPTLLELPGAALEQFPLRVPRAYVARMQAGNPRDPLLLQVLPQNAEEDDTPGFSNDPLSEAEFNTVPGLLQKYHSRALLIAAPHCAVHCRYCFRRHFPYAGNTPGRSHWQRVLEHIAADPAINEVILSGGDPLAAPDRHLSWLTRAIADISHVTRLRIHSRTPLVIPARVTDSMLAWLSETRLQTVMVLHCNHAQEIDNEVRAAITAMRHGGTILLNQSVLLRDVNDSEDALCALSEALFSAGVLPYYIHMPDRVLGTAHFDVRQSRAEALIHAMRARLPGYLVPRLVREIAGETAKTLIV